jgi:hypothetical protein
VTIDNRVRATLLEGLKDFQNLLVHLQTILAELNIPVLRAGGGLTFSGFSFQSKRDAPVDWIGCHIDRPHLVIHQIQDRILPRDCPLDRLKRLQARQYERTFSLSDNDFFSLNEREQMERLKNFLEETLNYLNGLPPEEEGESGPFIPVLGDRD